MSCGIYDFHVHLGETIAGHKLADDWHSFNRLHEHSGLEAVGVFVTESPDEPLAEKLSQMRESSKAFNGKVFWHLTPTGLDPEKIIPLLAEDTDLKLYTTYRKEGLYQSYEAIERLMNELGSHKPRLLLHCEDNATIEAYRSRYPFQKPIDHTLRRPEKAEVRAVEKMLDLAIKHKFPVHIVHVSTPQAALLIRDAKSEFAGISCETAPHYLVLNEDILNDPQGHRWLCSPPLRSENSRGQLVELLQDGVFDIIASDHCAFGIADKDKGILKPQNTPMGIAGSGALFSLLAEQLVDKGKLSFESLFELIGTKPANLMGYNPDPEKYHHERLGAPVPVLPSYSETPNPYQDFWSHYELRRNP